ncbi:MAG TPA: TIR domain-containing protein, partial [Phototrophicaceae bacterium]|nr:TIR domain-containing protein [Phototrophicaceae bacterium]
MKRVYICYTTVDRDAVLYITSQLRADGVDAYYDPERMISDGNVVHDGAVHTGGFTRRLEKEIRSRACVLFVQSPEALRSPLVQTELEFAYHHHAEIIPLVLKPLNIRETGEFRFLLNLNSVDFGGWQNQKRAQTALQELENQLLNSDDSAVIKIRNVNHLQPSVTLHGHNGWVREVVFSPDGYLLASCASDNSVCIWDIRTADRTGR